MKGQRTNIFSLMTVFSAMDEIASYNERETQERACI